MTLERDSKPLAHLMSYLGYFENRVSMLYREMSGKIWLSFVESLLAEVSIDGQKHAAVFKGLVDSLPKIEFDPNNCEEALVEACNSIDLLRKEIAEVSSLDEAAIMQLTDNLMAVEKSLATQYGEFVHPETVELLSEKLGRIYIMDVDVVRKLFEMLIRDEERHIEILATVKRLLDWSVLKKVDNTPQVRFQNPDSWTAPSVGA